MYNFFTVHMRNIARLLLYKGIVITSYRNFSNLFLQENALSHMFFDRHCLNLRGTSSPFFDTIAPASILHLSSCSQFPNNYRKWKINHKCGNSEAAIHIPTYKSILIFWQSLLLFIRVWRRRRRSHSSTRRSPFWP